MYQVISSQVAKILNFDIWTSHDIYIYVSYALKKSFHVINSSHSTFFAFFIMPKMGNRHENRWNFMSKKKATQNWDDFMEKTQHTDLDIIIRHLSMSLFFSFIKKPGLGFFLTEFWFFSGFCPHRTLFVVTRLLIVLRGSFTAFLKAYMFVFTKM